MYQVATGTAPEQERKSVELAIIEGIDAEIAELMKQLKAKQDDRAVVVAKVAGIDGEIDAERAKVRHRLCLVLLAPP